MMSFALTLSAAALVATSAAGANSSVDAVDIQGFAPTAELAESRLEQRFDSDLAAADLRAWMQQMASEPNHVGSSHDKANAEFQLKKFREWGWDASIET
jgi:N-acetylated-alpha-linked acidic dipeptidase